MEHTGQQGWGKTTELTCRATIRWPGGALEEIEIDLVGGREHHSVGGEIAEGFRWWAGRLRPGDVVVDLTDGTEVVLELDDRGQHRAVIETDDDTAQEEIHIRGLGPPPFEVT